MRLTDPIADMLTRIRNAQARGHRMVVIPYSALKVRILTILEREGYVGPFRRHQVPGRRAGSQRELIQLLLKYKGNQGVIQHLERISSPGRRVYLPAAKLRNPLSGLGLALVSTSKGLMSDKEAKAASLGGEILLHIW